MAMSLRNHLINLYRGNISFKDVWYYIQGSFRHRLFYSRFKFLIRGYIREQIALRIIAMRKECYDNGECIECGCSTTALQMCDKMCEGECYPTMMNKEQWKYFNEFKVIYIGDWYWRLKGTKLYKEKEYWFS